MVNKIIKIITRPETDRTMRLHALTIDESLLPDWNYWTQEQIIRTDYKEFTYEIEYDFDFGKHTITYANTGYAVRKNYSWYTEIYIDNKLVAAGLTGRDKYLKVTFFVSKRFSIPIGKIWRPIRTKTIQGIQTNIEQARLIDKIKMRIKEKM